MKKTLLVFLCSSIAVAAFAQKGDKKATAPVATPVKAAMPVLKTAKDSASYAYGIVLGNSIKRQMSNSELDNKIVTESVKATIGEETMAFSAEEASKIYNDYQKKAAAMAGQANMKAGEVFLAENKKRPGVITTASGLQYEVMSKGDQTAAMPVATDKVKVHYHGTLINGDVFDSSVQRGTPAEFPLNGVIKGWTEGLQYMHIGDKFKFFLPYQLAYGERSPSAKIKPYSTLVFEVELLEITTPK